MADLKNQRKQLEDKLLAIRILYLIQIKEAKMQPPSPSSFEIFAL